MLNHRVAYRPDGSLTTGATKAFHETGDPRALIAKLCLESNLADPVCKSHCTPLAPKGIVQSWWSCASGIA